MLGCAEFTAAVEPATLAALFVVDSSDSMTETTALGPTKWQALGQAFQAYLGAPEAAGSYAGIGFFPRIDASVPELCQTAADCGDAGDACRPLGLCVPHGSTTCVADKNCPSPIDHCMRKGMCQYGKTECALATESCPMAGDICIPASFCRNHVRCDASDYAIDGLLRLPEGAGALSAALAAQKPDDYTPTAPAVAGAIASASAWMAAHPRHTAVVVLATDGLPDRCDDDILDYGFAKGMANIAATVAQGAEDGVRTYVVGFFAPSEQPVAQAALDAVAAAGATGQARIILTDGDVTQLLESALGDVRADAACEYAIPTNTTVDLTKLRVFVDGAAVARVASAGACDADKGGFYYDLPPDGPRPPRRIILCPASCARGAAHTLRVSCR